MFPSAEHDFSPSTGCSTIYYITSYHNDDTTLPSRYPRDLWIDIRIDVFGVRQLYIYIFPPFKQRERRFSPFLLLLDKNLLCVP